MSETTQVINFPADLAKDILWSPNVDQGSGRSSRASYVLVTPDSQSRLASPNVEDTVPSNDEESVAKTIASDAPVEPVLSVTDESTTALDEATEPINIDVVPADNSSSKEEETPPQNEHAIPKLSDSIQEEMKVHISYKFSIDVQMDTVKAHKDFHAEKKQIVEPVVHIYCPHGECHEVLDGAVKEIATHEGAEVLTLDALELSTPEISVLGEQIHEALSALYKDPIRPDREENSDSSSESDTYTTSSDDTSDEESTKKRRREKRQRRRAAEQRRKKVRKEQKAKEKKNNEERKKKDLEIQAIFDALVSLSSQDRTAPAKKRIVYIRDFGSIVRVSKPLIVRLLRAIQARRVAKFSDGMESEDLIQPTLLVLGYSSTNSIGESVFVRGGDALREALPDISATSLRDKVSSITLSPIGSRFFLGSLVVKNDEKKKDSSNDYDSDDDCIPIFIRWGSRSRPSISSVGKSDSCTTFDGPLFTLDSFDLSSASLAMSVFYKGKDKKAFKAMEKSLSDRRKISVANAWFKLSLTQRKRRLACDDVVTFLGSDEDLQKDLVEDKDKDKGKKKKKERSRYPPMFGGMRNKTKDSEKSKEHQGPYKGQALLARLAELINPSISVTLDQGVAIVLGLSSPGRTPADAPEVPLSAFSKAFQTLIRNQKSRAELWKEPDSEDQKDKEDEKNEDPVVKSVKDASDLTSYESTLLSCIVDPNELTTAFEDVCISEKTIESLRTIISLRLKFPDAFTSGVLGRESMGGVLLYGPPGTGKTMVCRAVARECGARMLVVKPSDIMDKWVGESEKLVKAVFTLAYRLAPCLIFIDELDSFFSKRKEDDKKWVRDILAEFLQSMDGLKSAKKNKDAGVVLIGATNRPQDIDEAVIRRLPSRMMVDAPDEMQRQRILELHLRGETLDEDVKLSEIAAKTTNYSGSDLKNVCVSAAMASVKEAIGTFTWEPIKSKDVPKAGDDSKSDEIQGGEETNTPKENIDKRTVKMCHLTAALAEVPGSLSSSSTAQSELNRWHSQLGAGASSASSRPSYAAGLNRPGGYSGIGSSGSKPGGYTGAGSYGSGGNATGAGGYGSTAAGAGGYGSGGNATGAGGYGSTAAGAGGYGSGGNATGTGGYASTAAGTGGYASKYGAGSGSGYGAAGSGILGSGAGGSYSQPSGEANGTAAGAASNTTANSSLNIPRYGANTGAGGYGSNSNPASGATETNPNGDSSNSGQFSGRYPRYGASAGNGNSGTLNSDGAPSLRRFFGGGDGGSGIGGGIGNTGTGGFASGVGSAGGVLGGLGGTHGLGRFGSAGDTKQEPHASIEQVDEEAPSE